MRKLLLTKPVNNYGDCVATFPATKMFMNWGNFWVWPFISDEWIKKDLGKQKVWI